MTLKELRDSFILKSGRYDLIDALGNDQGANWFIQSGSKFLDRHADLKFASTQVVIKQVFGDGLVQLPNCWLVKDVFLYDGCAPIPLFQTHSSHAFQCQVRKGTPRFYQFTPNYHLANSQGVRASDIKERASTYVYSADGYPDLQLELLPHPNHQMTVEVHGRFYSDELAQDTDQNYWSVYASDTLLKAAMYELEVFYRNSEGAKDWLAAIDLDLLNMEQMEVQQTIIHKGQMEG